MKNQMFFFITSKILCILSLFVLLFSIVAVEGGRRPNFIVLFMDDLGYGDLGFTGHPTTKTPNLDRLAWNGKILTTWYSGCFACTGSRAALMTGRQFPRTGLPAVIGPTDATGLPLNESTIADQLKTAGYATAAIGKWHLGQRPLYLPGNRGFDYYLGIPYSDDMGMGITSQCPSNDNSEFNHPIDGTEQNPDSSSSSSKIINDELDWMQENGKMVSSDKVENDPAGKYLPLVYQEFNETRILEQPVDFTTLAQKYSQMAINFVEKYQNQPFFLYLPFSHVHATDAHQPEMQYAGCDFKGKTSRGSFGDALAEADSIVGNLTAKLKELNLEEGTLILFTSDNGPELLRGLSGGSEGLFTGRYAGYWSTGKASIWEGGIRMPAFAYWKGSIQPFSRSSEIISSMDVFPTLSKLAGVDLPSNRSFDGRDMSRILFRDNGKSKHEFLFFYGDCSGDPYYSIAAVRHGKYKAHWCTKSGSGQFHNTTPYIRRYDPPLLFDIEKDPSEAEPISVNEMPSHPDDLAAMQRILKAYAMEKSTFEFGKLHPYPDGPGEGPGRYGICCDRAKDCYCVDNDYDDPMATVGIFNLGTKVHHDKYHEVLGEEEPSPPRTRHQFWLQQMAVSTTKGEHKQS